MAHVRVKGLRTGRAQEDIAQDHETGCVDVGKQKHNAAHRVQGAKDRPIVCLNDVHEAHGAEEAKPYGHNRAEGLADA